MDVRPALGGRAVAEGVEGSSSDDLSENFSEAESAWRNITHIEEVNAPNPIVVGTAQSEPDLR